MATRSRIPGRRDEETRARAYLSRATEQPYARLAALGARVGPIEAIDERATATWQMRFKRLETQFAAKNTGSPRKPGFTAQRPSAPAGTAMQTLPSADPLAFRSPTSDTSFGMTPHLSL